MKKLLLMVSTSLLFNINIMASDIGKDIFIEKCSICHSLVIPIDKSTMLAPPAMGIMFHMREFFSDDEDIINHIVNFSLNPTKETSKLGAVRRFGLMPSQKGIITEKELTIVSKWMIQNFNMSEKEHALNQKKHKDK